MRLMKTKVSDGKSDEANAIMLACLTTMQKAQLEWRESCIGRKSQTL